MNKAQIEVEQVSFSELWNCYVREERRLQALFPDDQDRATLAGWKSHSGKWITNDENPGLDAQVNRARGRAAFPWSADGNKWECYVVDLETLTMVPGTAREQFTSMRDANLIAKKLAQDVMDYSFIIKAFMLGKGHNAAELIAYKRNQDRSGALVAYRKKMQNRQVPLKPRKQWSFWVKMIESGEYTAAALQELLNYAKSLDSEETKTLDPKWNANKAETNFAVNIDEKAQGGDGEEN